MGRQRWLLFRRQGHPARCIHAHELRGNPGNRGQGLTGPKMTTAIITMAGFGRRFLDAGYKVPKYRIVVHERSLFSWAMLSLAQFIEAGTDFVFVARAADEAETFIREQAAALNIRSTNV